jgi:hypothetical protein
MEHNPESLWLESKLASLEPTWQPNLARALATHRPNKPLRPWLLAATAASLLFIALPQTRALAQDLWHRLTLGRIEAVRIDLSQLPIDSSIKTNGLARKVANVEEATASAGYQPNLPMIGSTPEIVVNGPISLTQTFRKATPFTVRAEFGPSIIAGYPEDLQVVQSQPPQLYIPEGLDIEQLIDTTLRSIGVPAAEASRFARDFKTQPALLLQIPPEEDAQVAEITLRHGPAMLIEDRNDQHKPERYTILFHTPNRLYAISAADKSLAIRAANLIE